MKICFITFYYPPDLCAGSFRAEALIKALLRRKDTVKEIEIFTTIPNRYISHLIQNANQTLNKKLIIHRIYVPKHKSTFWGQAIAFFFFAYGVFFRVKNQEWDVVVSTSSRLMTAFLGALIAKKKKIKLYLDIRDLFVDTMSDILSQSLVGKFIFIFKYIENWTFNRANKINIVSHGFDDYMKNKAKKITFSHFTNGIDEIFNDTNLNKIKKNFPKKINVLYAGNIGSGQALHRVIPDFSLIFRDIIKFTIVGDGGKRKQLEKIIKERNITNVSILNPVDRKKLNYYYKKADILFLHLNDIQAFKKVLPSKIFEYGSLGKPIIAGVDGYSTKFLKEEMIGCFVFKPCDISSLKKVFIQAIQGKTFYDRSLFIKKYNRSNIMMNMANDIIETSKQ